MPPWSSYWYRITQRWVHWKQGWWLGARLQAILYLCSWWSSSSMLGPQRNMFYISGSHSMGCNTNKGKKWVVPSRPASIYNRSSMWARIFGTDGHQNQGSQSPWSWSWPAHCPQQDWALRWRMETAWVWNFSFTNHTEVMIVCNKIHCFIVSGPHYHCLSAYICIIGT